MVGTGTTLTGDRQYDALGRTADTHYHVAAMTVSRHTCTCDAAHRRTRADREDGGYWACACNDRDEVVSAKRHLANGAPLAGWQQEFGYDDLGNRVMAKDGGDSQGAGLRQTGYQVNALNQYHEIDHPSRFDVLGRALGEASVTVNGQAADRQDEFWRRELTADNSAGPAFPTVEVTASRAGVGVGGAGRECRSRWRSLPAAPGRSDRP